MNKIITTSYESFSPNILNFFFLKKKKSKICEPRSFDLLFIIIIIIFPFCGAHQEAWIWGEHFTA
jgi:hypothetical protein